jgi:hypothetical protein
MLWHAYIDESGDRGWKQRPAGTPVGQAAGSSRTFAMTAVMMPDGKGPEYMAAWDGVAKSNGPATRPLAKCEGCRGEEASPDDDGGPA